MRKAKAVSRLRACHRTPCALLVSALILAPFSYKSYPSYSVLLQALQFLPAFVEACDPGLG